MLIKLMRLVLKIICLIAFSVCAARFCRSKTDGFSVDKISSDLTYQPEWAIAALPEEEKQAVRKILSQPFSYLGKGAQAFVFSSKDGKYVIKLFRHHHMRPPFWIKCLPFDWAESRIEKKMGKLWIDFASYKLAFEDLRNETGMIFLHLNKSNDLHQKILIIDKIGIAHTLEADQMEFLIQKRAELIYPGIQKLMETGQEEKARSAVQQLVHLLALRCEKRIWDKDPDLNTNFGLVEGSPIQIDVGRFRRLSADKGFDEFPSKRISNRFYKMKSINTKDEVIRITDHLHQWLQARFPQLDDTLKIEIGKINETL